MGVQSTDSGFFQTGIHGCSASLNNATTGITMATAGSDGAHNNMPPSVIVPWIIRII